MIEFRSFAQFISGRAVGLVLSLTFQVVVARLLMPSAYAQYALAMGLVALLQTLTSFGLPRVIAKFLSQAGEGVSFRAARRLAAVLLGARTASMLGALAVAALIAFAVQPPGFSAALAWSGAAYGLAATLLMDADSMAQALGLQVASRRIAIGEPGLRLGGAGLLALTGDGRTADLLWIAAAAAALAGALLIGGVFSALFRPDPAPEPSRLDWRQVRRAAVGGYGGTLSWLAFSPATMRLLAARVLPLDLFAGFSFVQTLVVSLQHYAPSFVLFPLVEPLLMADAARTGRPDRLAAGLSLLVEADTILIGGVIVFACAAGGPLVLGLTHGRYGAAATYLPWLLAGIVANASHRSCEIAAIALDRAEALIRTLYATLGWAAVAILAAPTLGVWAFLLAPLADGLTRLWIVQRALGRPSVLDWRGAAFSLAGAAGLGWVSAATAGRLHGELGRSLGAGLAAVLIFLALVALFKPVRSAEVARLIAGAPGLEGLAAWRGGRSARLSVVVLTPRGLGGTGGVDRLMDSLRGPLAARSDVRVRLLTTRGSRTWASPAVALAALCAWRRRVIHVNLGAHGGCYRKMLLLAIPRLLGTPYVLHLHGSAFEGFWARAPAPLRRRIDRLFADAAQVIVLGETGRRLVTERAPRAAQRTAVLPNATPPFTLPRSSSPSARILFLGELGPRKGADVLVEALGRLPPGGPWRAVIAGDGDRAALGRRVRALGLAEQVDLPGWLDPMGVNACLAASDILVLPSFEETLPMAVVEAFGAGLAVIATPVGSLADILIPEETGLFVAPSDAEGLAQAIHRLAAAPELRQSLGQAAKAYHARRLSIGPYCDELVDLWRRVQVQKIT